MAGANVSDAEASEGMEEQIQFVAHEIGRDWKKLGRKLITTEAVIEGIEDEFKQLEEKAYQILKKWSRANGKSGATREALCEALKAIGRKSIAERICAHKHSNESPEKPSKQDIDERKSCRNSPEPDTPATCHHLHRYGLARFEKTLNEMYEDCIDNLSPATDGPTLVSKLKLAYHLKDLNAILSDMIKTDSNTYINGERIERARMTKSCEKRYKQTDQTMRLILQTLTDRGQPAPRKSKATKTRPASEILPRCTSLVSLQPRSGTFGSEISSPISASKNSILSRTESRASSPLCDQICEEEPTETSVFLNLEEQPAGCIPRCESCGSCLYFEARMQASEDQETSLDENCNEASEAYPVPDEITGDDLLPNSQDCKL